tara:strand:+ start:130 stop:474 length:345 start_codon:yes stop_codon:yes gene_type:complete
MALISNGTTVASGGTVQGSAANLSSIPSPSNSAILTAVATASDNVVGSYIFGNNQNQGYGARTRGQTRAGSTLQAGNAQGSVTGAALSGTWMCMGQDLDGSQNGGRATLWFRRS